MERIPLMETHKNCIQSVTWMRANGWAGEGGRNGTRRCNSCRCILYHRNSIWRNDFIRHCHCCTVVAFVLCGECDTQHHLNQPRVNGWHAVIPIISMKSRKFWSGVCVAYFLLKDSPADAWSRVNDLLLHVAMEALRDLRIQLAMDKNSWNRSWLSVLAYHIVCLFGTSFLCKQWNPLLMTDFIFSQLPPGWEDVSLNNYLKRCQVKDEHE
jgi:hypothetical protein